MKPGQPAVPFHSTFDFRFAYIDFGCAVHFSPDATDHLVTAEHIPPSHFAAPEQSEGKPYDMFASDVFNVGKVLETELEEAMQVRKLISLLRFVDWVNLKEESPAAVNAATVAPAYMDLLQDMTRPEPSKRPSAVEALAILTTIIADLPPKTYHHHSAL